MRICLSVGDIVCDLETDEPLPTFDVVETLLNRCADAVLGVWWEINTDEDAEVEALELSEPPADNA